MKKWIQNMLLLFQLLTRVPINKALPCEENDFRRASNFFPIVGLFIGIIQYILCYFLDTAVTAYVMALIVALAEIILTGGFHVDGFADTCDGFFAYKGKDRIISIMKDSRLGTFGCIAIVADMLLRVLLLGDIIADSAYSSLYILIIPIIARTYIAFLSYIGKPAKEEGMGNLFIETVTIREVIVGIVVGMLITFGVLGIIEGLILFITATAVTILFNVYCKSKIGGVTGDSLGANNEIVTIALMIVVYIMI